MTKHIGILHYTGPPIVGGVESLIAHQAHGLAKAGYRVRIICGSGASLANNLDTDLTTHIHPLFSSSHPHILAIKHELDGGVVSDGFHQLVAEQHRALQHALDGCDVCVVHNIHTLHKNLPLSVALRRLEGMRLVAFCHDLAWTNPQYLPELHTGYPWQVLREVWQNTTYVTISWSRQEELATLFNIPKRSIGVLTPGIDVASFLQWTPTTHYLEQQLLLLDANGLLLLPARLTRRKNIELGLHVLAELKQQTHDDYRLIITGPPGAHNPTNFAYLDQLRALRDALGIQDSVHFLYELGEPTLIVDDLTMANLYQLSDALFFPSLQEGFGIPMLEAGLIGLPIFCSRLAPLQETVGANATFFDPIQDQPSDIAKLIHTHLNQDPRHHLKVKVRHHYRWETLIQAQLIPLLEA
jgi:glycosyltransferase involved in cell wall biosynthesis